MITVSGLYLYPVKSFRGISVPEMVLDARGPARDRRFMLVDAAGKFITQRIEPRFSLVDVAIDGDMLVIRAPGMDALRVERAPTSGPSMDVEVWDDRCTALEIVGAREWLRAYVQRDLHMVYMPDEIERAVSPKYGRAGDVLSFADAFPFLVISEESLSDLNGRLEAPLEMRRFRPNIVLRGAEPFAEDRFDRIRIADVPFRGTKRCDRCAVTTVDPETGERGKEPLATLATYRSEAGRVYFGLNLIHDAEGEIRIGDEVIVESETDRWNSTP